MKQTFFLLILSCASILSSCSNDEEKKKSSIDSFTEETAQKAVQHIQEPLEKARAVQKLVDKHAGEIEKGIEDKN